MTPRPAVAEPLDPSLFGRGEALRGLSIASRARRLKLLPIAATAALVAALLATLAWSPRPRLVWNASASAPPGLYLIGRGDSAAPGDMVIAWPPEAARRLGAERRYVPINVPLVKRVAAASGDRVCAAGKAIFVNGRLEALRQDRDPAGRPMPGWAGCVTVPAGDLFLLTPDTPLAFDGRYFGITARDRIVGGASLLWSR